METANDVWPYVLAAIDAYGTGVLAKTSELASDTPPARGSRILQRVFGRGDAHARQVIANVAGAKPDDEASRAALKMALMEAFQADPLLRYEVGAMLPRVVVSVAVGDDDTVIVAGDGDPLESTL